MRGHWTSTVVQVTGSTKVWILALLFHEPGHLLWLRWHMFPSKTQGHEWHRAGWALSILNLFHRTVTESSKDKTLVQSEIQLPQDKDVSSPGCFFTQKVKAYMYGCWAPQVFSRGKGTALCSCPGLIGEDTEGFQKSSEGFPSLVPAFPKGTHLSRWLFLIHLCSPTHPHYFVFLKIHIVLNTTIMLNNYIF